MRIIERDGFQCCGCGRRVEGKRDTHVDHVVPLSKGGSNDDSNLRTTCAACNLTKGAV